jgi:undecaprenyl pyrophosphate phosphatase UppP
MESCAAASLEGRPMSNHPSAQTKGSRVWLPLWVLVAVAFAVGLYLGLNRSDYPSIDRWIKPVMAVAFVTAGVLLLIGSRHDDRRKIHNRASATAMVLLGVAQVTPNVTARMTISGVALLCILAVIAGIPRRLFGPRST